MLIQSQNTIINRMENLRITVRKKYIFYTQAVESEVCVQALSTFCAHN